MNIDPVVLWFIIGLVLALLEFVVPGVILIFFGIGAWVAAATTYAGLTDSVGSQLLVFSASSIALLVSLRKWIKGKFYGHVAEVQDLNVNLDEFTGKDVVVLEDVVPGKSSGAVEFKGAKWKAVSEEQIMKGEEAVIAGNEGITLRIRKK
jgi:membrane protein implicated in regulation of membrane protease activity